MATSIDHVTVTNLFGTRWCVSLNSGANCSCPILVMTSKLVHIVPACYVQKIHGRLVQLYQHVGTLTNVNSLVLGCRLWKMTETDIVASLTSDQ